MTPVYIQFTLPLRKQSRNPLPSVKLSSCRSLMLKTWPQHLNFISS